METAIHKLVSLGQRRCREEVTQAEMLSAARAIGSQISEAAESSGEEEAAELLAESGVARRFELAGSDPARIEEALVVGTCVLQATQPLGPTFFVPPAKAFLKGLIFTALPASSAPETENKLFQQVVGVVSELRAVAQTTDDNATLAWIKSVVAE